MVRRTNLSKQTQQSQQSRQSRGNQLTRGIYKTRRNTNKLINELKSTVQVNINKIKHTPILMTALNNSVIRCGLIFNLILPTGDRVFVDHNQIGWNPDYIIDTSDQLHHPDNSHKQPSDGLPDHILESDLLTSNDEPCLFDNVNNSNSKRPYSLYYPDQDSIFGGSDFKNNIALDQGYVFHNLPYL
jgi:hypothetical protein